MRTVRPLGLALLLVAGVPAVASAHIRLDWPPARTTQQKQPSCGVTGSTRSDNPTVLPPGATITVMWTETINHPGHYRISFDATGEDFTIPLDFMDLSQTRNVLVDNIADRSGANLTYTQEITLPDVECESCTLQLIQMMYDKPPYGDGNDIYFQCADLALRRDAPLPPDGGGGSPADPDGGVGEPRPPGEAIGGCSVAARQPGWLVLSLALLLATRRRRRGSKAH